MFFQNKNNALKKAIISAIIGCITLVTAAQGDNILIIQDVEADAGDIITIALEIQNDDPFAGFNCDIYIPEGFTYIEESAQLHRHVNHVLVFTILEGNIARMMAYSLPVTAFEGNEGVVLTMDFQSPDTGGEFPLEFRMTPSPPVIANLNAENILTGTVNGTIYLSAYFTVQFNVLNAQGEELTDAVITLNGISNEPGDYVFADVETGHYIYTVTAAGYDDFSGELVVEDEDLSVNVIMTLTTYTVTFEVSNQTGVPVADAVITLNGAQNMPGEYSFDNMAPGTYIYTVSADNYFDAMDEITVMDADLTIVVQLQPDDTGIMTKTPEKVHIYPNPVRNDLHIAYYNPDGHPVKISLNNTDGKVQKNYTDTGYGPREIRLNISALSPGIYLLKLESDHVYHAEWIVVI